VRRRIHRQPVKSNKLGPGRLDGETSAHPKLLASMIGLGLFVQMADTRDMRCVAFLFRPSDGFVLGLKRSQDTVGVVLHDIVLGRASI
jgi:hypothetical protein